MAKKEMLAASWPTDTHTHTPNVSLHQNLHIIPSNLGCLLLPVTGHWLARFECGILAGDDYTLKMVTMQAETVKWLVTQKQSDCAYMHVDTYVVLLGTMQACNSVASVACVAITAVYILGLLYDIV